MIFKPEDFIELGFATSDIAANKANKKLQAHLATLPRVKVKKDSHIGWIANEQGFQDGPGTHTAILMDIQEIKKNEEEKCEHEEPELILGDEGFLVSWSVIGQPNISQQIKVSIKCAKCGVKLKAKWENDE